MINCQNSGIIARSLILVLVLLIRHVSLNDKYDNMFAMISVGVSFKLNSGLLVSFFYESEFAFICAPCIVYGLGLFFDVVAPAVGSSVGVKFLSGCLFRLSVPEVGHGLLVSPLIADPVVVVDRIRLGHANGYYLYFGCCPIYPASFL